MLQFSFIDLFIDLLSRFK